MASLDQTFFDLFKESERNELRIKELRAQLVAASQNTRMLDMQVQLIKEDMVDLNMLNKISDTACNKVKEMAQVIKESNKVLLECNKLLAFFGSFKNPLLAEKQETLARLKRDWADFKAKVDQTEVGTPKDNEAMKVTIAELKQQLSTVREQKFALIKEYNELRREDRVAESDLLVKFVTLKVENDGKMKELETDSSKLRLLQIESENRKRSAEMKELELSELKKRFGKFASEDDDYYTARFDYIDFTGRSFGSPPSPKIVTPCTSESSLADSLISGTRSGTVARQFTGWDNVQNGANNQGIAGRRATPASDAPPEQPRQSVLQVNPNRKPSKSPLPSHPPPNQSSVASTSRRFAGDRSKSVIVDDQNIGEFQNGTKRQRLCNNATDRNGNKEIPEQAVEHTAKPVTPEPELVNKIPPTIRRDPSSHGGNRNHRKEPTEEKIAKPVRPEQQPQSAKKTPVMVRHDPPLITQSAAPMASTGGKRDSNASEPRSTESSSVPSNASTVSFENSSAQIQSETQKPSAQKLKTPTSTVVEKRAVPVNLKPSSSAQTSSGSRGPNQAMANVERNRKISISSTSSLEGQGQGKSTEQVESDPFGDETDPFAVFYRAPNENARKRSSNNDSNRSDGAKKPKGLAQREEDDNADMTSSNEDFAFEDDGRDVLQFSNDDKAMGGPEYDFFHGGGEGDDIATGFDEEMFDTNTSFQFGGGSFNFGANDGGANDGGASGFSDFEL